MSTAKKQFLVSEGLINPKAERLLYPPFRETEFFDPLDLPQVRYEMLRAARVDPLSVAEACRQFGFSREHFYQLERAFLQRGFVALVATKRGRRPLLALNEEIVTFIIHRKFEEQRVTGGQLRREIQRRFKVDCSTRTVERIVKNLGLVAKKGAP